MKKVTFNVILRMPNYYSDGLLQVTETKGEKEMKVKALFTIDKAIGELKDGIMELDFLYHDIDLSMLNIKINGFKFTINVDVLYSPMKYSFEYDNDSENYSIEFVSVERDISKINYLETAFK